MARLLAPLRPSRVLLPLVGMSAPLLAAPPAVGSSSYRSPCPVASTPQDPQAARLELRTLEQRVSAGIERALPSVVQVQVGWENDDRDEVALGSGVILSADGLVLTAAHLVEHAGEAATLILADGSTCEARALGQNGRADLALLRILDEAPEGGWPTVALAQAGPEDVLGPVLALGHPDADVWAVDAVPRLGVLHDVGPRWLRATTTVMPGDSGGGLFTLDGELLGITSWIALGSERNHFVPVQRALEQLERLEAGEEIDPVPLDEVERLFSDPGRRAQLYGMELREGDTGPEVARVRPGSAAERAGLVPGDRTVTVDGRAVDDVDALERRLRLKARAPSLTLEVQGPGEAAPRTLVLEAVEERPVRARAHQALGLQAEDHPLRRSVVRLTHGRGRDRKRTLGSVLEDGLLVAKSSEVDDASLVHLPSGRQVPVEVLGRDLDTDLVLLRVESDELVPLTLGELPELAPGAVVCSLGPGGSVEEVGVLAHGDLRVPPFWEGDFWGVLRHYPGGGMQVRERFEGGNLEAADIAVGDVLLRLDDAPLRNRADLRAALHLRAPGERVELLVLSDGDLVRRQVELGPPFLGEDGPGLVHLADALPLSRRRDGFPGVLRHDALVGAADCGGPLLDPDGRVLGVNVARADRTCCYAVPADRVRDVVDGLLERAEAERRLRDFEATGELPPGVQGIGGGGPRRR